MMSGYRYMRTLVFFDLPTLTAAERKAAALAAEGADGGSIDVDAGNIDVGGDVPGDAPTEA